MNTHARVLVITLILIATFALLGWMRSDNMYDFDIRSVIPFMRGRGVTLHDWGALALILLGVWGVRRLYKSANTSGSRKQSRSHVDEDYDVEDDVDRDV